MQHDTLVSVIVPNYNGGRFLRECLDSVLGQSHRNLEVLVVDGGSTDASLEILRGYGDRIAWVSEPDRGQAHAIQKGFQRVHGELVGWLNSDDVLVPDAISRVVAAAHADPEAVLFLGDVELIDENGKTRGLSRAREISHESMRSGRGKVLQPGSFYREWAVRRAGGTDETFHLLMDVDLWIRLLRYGTSHVVRAPLARFRIHPAAKSSQAPYRYYLETIRLGIKHERDRLPAALLRRVRQVIIYHAAYSLGIRGTLERARMADAAKRAAGIWARVSRDTPSGALICVSGVDGSGKSTQIDRLAAELASRGCSPRVFWLRPGYSPELDFLRATVRRVHPGSLPTAAKPAERAAAFAKPRTQALWFWIAIFDMMFQYGVKVRAWRRLGQEVICDRYISDAEVDLRLRFPDVANRFEKAFELLSRTCPTPDLALMLLVPDATADSRLDTKDEPFPEAPEVRARRRQRYRSLGESGDFVVIDADGSIDSVAAAVLAAADQVAHGRA